MRIGMRQIILLAGVLVLLALAPWLGSSYLTGVFTLCLIYAIWAMAWDFFTGLSGRENFGFQMFIGVGAYASAWLDVNHGISPWIGLPVAVAVAALFGLLIGFPTLRLRGPYFALATLAAAVIIEHLMVILWEITGGEEGLNGLTPLIYEPVPFYYLTLGVALASAVVLVALTR